ncbi:MAG TPA: hypothetical protein VLG40_03585 [Candidatus Saccharimonas sp.]|nr:hypothetical protein [Candidatus Saccharimonas sp.]
MSQSAAPRRELNVNFTEQTFRRSIATKKRLAHWRHTKRIFMNIPQFVKQPMGAAIAVATISLSAVGAYAAVNWFNGSVQVSQKDNSVLSVDVSSCKGPTPPGFEPTDDKRNLQFKVLKNPHISATDLQRALLQDCELDAAKAFFKGQPSTQNSGTFVANIKAISPTSITFTYLSYGSGTRTVSTAGLSLFNQGAKATVADLHVGDHVVVALDTPKDWVEDQNLIELGTVRGVFKTQYDVTQAPSATKKGFYDDSNIMPLDWYNQVHEKLHI